MYEKQACVLKGELNADLHNHTKDRNEALLPSCGGTTKGRIMHESFHNRLLNNNKETFKKKKLLWEMQNHHSFAVGFCALFFCCLSSTLKEKSTEMAPKLPGQSSRGVIWLPCATRL